MSVGSSEQVDLQASAPHHALRTLELALVDDLQLVALLLFLPWLLLHRFDYLVDDLLLVSAGEQGRRPAVVELFGWLVEELLVQHALFD